MDNKFPGINQNFEANSNPRDKVSNYYKNKWGIEILNFTNEKPSQVILPKFNKVYDMRRALTLIETICKDAKISEEEIEFFSLPGASLAINFDGSNLEQPN